MVPSPLRTLREILADDVWRFALVAGGLSAWAVLSESWQSASNTLEFTPVFVAAVVGGYLFRTRRADRTSVGLRTGLVGSLPVFWQATKMLGFIPGFDQPTWFGLAQVVVVVAYVALSVAAVSLSGVVGAVIGDWLASKTGRTPPPVVAGH